MKRLFGYNIWYFYTIHGNSSLEETVVMAKSIVSILRMFFVFLYGLVLFQVRFCF